MFRSGPGALASGGQLNRCLKGWSDGAAESSARLSRPSRLPDRRAQCRADYLVSVLSAPGFTLLPDTAFHHPQSSFSRPTTCAVHYSAAIALSPSSSLSCGYFILSSASTSTSMQTCPPFSVSTTCSRCLSSTCQVLYSRDQRKQRRLFLCRPSTHNHPDWNGT